MKTNTFLTGLLILGSLTSAADDGRRQIKEGGTLLGEDSNCAATFKSSVEVVPLITPDSRQEASVEQKSIILYEDFNGVPDGETERISEKSERYTTLIASRNYEPGRFIDNDYTPGSGTWEGNWVYAGKGGTVVLQPYTDQTSGVLRTPLGDYSGDLTVTVRVRYSKTFWATDNGYVTTGGSDMGIMAYLNGYDDYTRAVTDMNNGYLLSSQIYPAEGWQEVSFNFRNQSAGSGGNLSIYTTSAIEIDWIKVVDNNTYIASPAVHEPTNYTKDGFTISWDPVRRSYNYYIDLYKAVYTRETGLDESYDFEGGSLPEWLECNDYESVEGEGAGGTTAIMLTGEYEDGALVISSPDDLPFDSVTAKFKFEVPEDYDFAYAYDEDTLPYIVYEVFGEDGWEEYGYEECDDDWIYPGKYYTLILKGKNFEGKYHQVRIYAGGVTDTERLYLDDVTGYARRPYALERVYADFSRCWDKDNDDYSYNYYTFTGSLTDPQEPIESDTSYTFSGLDPEGEYWYRVRSHHVKDFSIGEKHHAFGVIAPTILPATNLTTTSYTANWKDVPKAQKYYVTNYTLREVANDESSYMHMAETYFNCKGETTPDEMNPIGNDEECYLNDFTDLKGWRGRNNSVGRNMIGAAAYSDGYLITPPMMVNPERGPVVLHIQGKGADFDKLYVQCLKEGSYGNIYFDEKGKFDVWMDVPVTKGEQMYITSVYGESFGLTAYEVYQDVKAGDVVLNFDSLEEVEAAIGSVTFGGLSDVPYAYNVVANYTFDDESVNSVSGSPMYVNFNPTSVATLGGEEATELARYSIDGLRVDNFYQGIVIVKMSDGSTKKKIVR